MSEKWNAPKVLQSLNFKLDESQDIGVLLDAAMPGNKYQFLSVLGMTISMSNSDAVRFFSKQHPNVSGQCFNDFLLIIFLHSWLWLDLLVLAKVVL